MEKRNLTPLRNVLVRYLVVCGGGSLVILLVWWGLFMSLIHNGFLLPPVTGAQVCSDPLVTKDQLDEWYWQTRFARAYYYFLMCDINEVFILAFLSFLFSLAFLKCTILHY